MKVGGSDGMMVVCLKKWLKNKNSRNDDNDGCDNMKTKKESHEKVIEKHEA